DLGTATALLNLGDAERQLGDLDRAVALVDQALVIFEELGATRQAASALGSLGKLAHIRGDGPLAVKHLTRALALAHASQDVAGTVDIIEWLGVEASALGDPRRGAFLLGAADALDTAIGAERPPAEVPEYQSDVVAVRTATGQPAFDVAWAEGAAAPLDDVIA